MTSLPSDDEIAEKARELGCVDDAGNVDPRRRAKIVQVLMREKKATSSENPFGQLLSRTVTDLGESGYLTVEIRLHKKAPQ